MWADDLRALLDELAGDPGLWEPQAFAARTEALDRLEFATLGYEDALAGTVDVPGREPVGGDGAALLYQAAGMTRRLVEANRVLCETLRAAIRRGELRGDVARRTFERLAAPSDVEAADMGGAYDVLDSLVSALLLDAEAPGATLPEAAERVAYQPTPARVVLELLDRVALGPDDVFYDLGAGLGHVCVLVHLLSGAHARGVEIEPAYIRYARQQASALRLTGVEFIEGDVRVVSLAGGACYFLYTPFTGRTLAAALGRLAAEARGRAITVAAYGPCVAEVARQPWLRRLDEDSTSGLAIFHSS